MQFQLGTSAEYGALLDASLRERGDDAATSAIADEIATLNVFLGTVLWGGLPRETLPDNLNRERPYGSE